MNRILKINFKDIIYDIKNVSSLINKACSRKTKMAIVGGFIKPENLILCLEELDLKIHKNIESYILAPFEEISESGIIGEISSRYYAGFSTIICVEINNTMWGLFAKRNIE
ncbi:MAG TPA: hypothetical protein QF753_22665 [Victivallales bacterium]|nr:hypothetical protein [Victivallales bacterium]